VMAGNSAHAATTAVRHKLLKLASTMLEADESNLEIDGAMVRVVGGNRSMTFAELVRANTGLPGYKLPGGLEPGISATKHVIIDPMTYANGTGVAEVEVDPETGGVEVLKFTFAHDSGRLIHPQIVDGQLVGGIAHAIGNALYEWMGYDDNAQPVTTTLAEYLLVTATEMPPITLIHHETPSPLNPLGIKGVGESGTMPTAAAIVSAVEHALSPYAIRIRKVPVTPADLASWIEEAEQHVVPPAA
jgi:aerobic carbon-monoxide dehydrogenase large subunit